MNTQEQIKNWLIEYKESLSCLLEEKVPINMDTDWLHINGAVTSVEIDDWEGVDENNNDKLYEGDILRLVIIDNKSGNEIHLDWFFHDNGIDLFSYDEAEGRSISQVPNEIYDEVYEQLISTYENFRNQLTTSDYVRIHNVICHNDDLIYDNDEFTINDIFQSAYDALRGISFGDYNLNDDYFVFNGYGNIVSFSYYFDENSPIDVEKCVKIEFNTRY